MNNDQPNPDQETSKIAQSAAKKPATPRVRRVCPNSIVVKVDPSTFRWLRAFAKANCFSSIHDHEVTPATLLAQAAFCIADHAGRRTGSWEANAGWNLVIPSGYQEQIPMGEAGRLHRIDRRVEKLPAAEAFLQWVTECKHQGIDS